MLKGVFDIYCTCCQWSHIVYKPLRWHLDNLCLGRTAVSRSGFRSASRLSLSAVGMHCPDAGIWRSVSPNVQSTPSGMLQSLPILHAARMSTAVMSKLHSLVLGLCKRMRWIVQRRSDIIDRQPYDPCLLAQPFFLWPHEICSPLGGNFEIRFCSTAL